MYIMYTHHAPITNNIVFYLKLYIAITLRAFNFIDCYNAFDENFQIF